MGNRHFIRHTEKEAHKLAQRFEHSDDATNAEQNFARPERERTLSHRSFVDKYAFPGGEAAAPANKSYSFDQSFSV